MTYFILGSYNSLVHFWRASRVQSQT